MKVREATADDEVLFWRWANDPVTRRWSWSTSPIEWRDHQVWFRSKLADPSCVLLVGEEDAASVGQVRFDIAGGIARLSFSIAPEHRGHGHSGPLLRSALRSLAGSVTVRRVVAEVKTDNLLSWRALHSAGFSVEHTDERATTMVAGLP